ncbi:hypothetical protein Daura_34870 [Dactylosporangium aurantiacum]|uniref:Uncharacterized protein n=1 Tax=Dactylosporangium aurantiacum TaxID=35754 RepID=A0A9Q9I8R7_9ACTN|nr:hypothetical protein [Dactylosporangium aurantiacum]UWZ51869.1 hypothetical protein Daura_34870 [Dactylosporangium aurantiacum]
MRLQRRPAEQPDRGRVLGERSVRREALRQQRRVPHPLVRVAGQPRHHLGLQRRGGGRQVVVPGDHGPQLLQRAGPGDLPGQRPQLLVAPPDAQQVDEPVQVRQAAAGDPVAQQALAPGRVAAGDVHGDPGVQLGTGVAGQLVPQPQPPRVGPPRTAQERDGPGRDEQGAGDAERERDAPDQPGRDEQRRRRQQHRGRPPRPHGQHRRPQRHPQVPPHTHAPMMPEPGGRAGPAAVGVSGCGGR